MGNVPSSYQSVKSDKFHVDLVDRHAPFPHEVDAIVCFINEHWHCNDTVSQALLELGGNRYESHLAHLKTKCPQCRVGEVHMVRGEKLPCKVVLFCVVPPPTKGDHESEKQVVAMAIDNIFSTSSTYAQDIQLQSIAFPVETGYPTPEAAALLPYLFCRQLSDDCSVKQIHIVTQEENTYQKLCQTVNDFHKTWRGIQKTSSHQPICMPTDDNASPVIMPSNSNTEPSLNRDIKKADRLDGVLTSQTMSSDLLRQPDIDSKPSIAIAPFSKESRHSKSPTTFETSPRLDIVSLTCSTSFAGRTVTPISATVENVVSSTTDTLSNPTSCSDSSEKTRKREHFHNNLLCTDDSSRYQNDLSTPIKVSPVSTLIDARSSTKPRPDFTHNAQNSRPQFPVSTPTDVSESKIPPPSGSAPSEASLNEYNSVNKDSTKQRNPMISAYNNRFTTEETLNHQTQSVDGTDDSKIPWKKTILRCPGDQLWREFTQDEPPHRSASSNRVVTFSETDVLKEIDSDQPPEFVRSGSCSSTDDDSLDYRNIIVKKPPKSDAGRRSMKSLATIEVQYNPDVIEQKESGTYFCVICQTEKPRQFQKKLEKCEHVFCKTCIETQFEHHPMCPICKQGYGCVIGNMPDGVMSHLIIKESLPGYETEQCGTIVVEYYIPSGIQTEKHPNPGQQYKGLQRKAFIPNTVQGQKVLRLLEKAFNQKLTFTVGRSRTTGRDNVVTWNDIHHKTRTHGGPTRFGYPDPEYLNRIERELKCMGITDDN